MFEKFGEVASVIKAGLLVAKEALRSKFEIAVMPDHMEREEQERVIKKCYSSGSVRVYPTV